MLGVAWVGLRVQLGHVPGPQHHQVHPQFSNKNKESPSRLRRRARRAAKRNAENAESAENVDTAEEVASNLEVVEADKAATKEAEKAMENKAAENATNDITDNKANDTTTVEVEEVAEEATSEHSCDLCEINFATLRGLKQHQGRQHKAQAISSIPQMDGAGDVIDYNLFCKICEDCHEDTKTIDDLSYHVMNDHEVADVMESYGQIWIEERHHCIRQGSPFHHLNPH